MEIPNERLEQIQAHLDEGGKFDNAIVQELVNYIILLKQPK